MSSRMRVISSGKYFLQPLLAKIREAFNKAGPSRLLHKWEVDVPSALLACAHVREVNWKYLQFLGCFPYDFGIGKVGIVSLHKISGSKRE